MAEKKEEERTNENAPDKGVASEVTGGLRKILDKIDEWLKEGKTPRVVLASIALGILYLLGDTYGNALLAMSGVYSNNIQTEMAGLRKRAKEFNARYRKWAIRSIVVGLALIFIGCYTPLSSGEWCRKAGLYLLFATVIYPAVAMLMMASIGNGLSKNKDGKEGKFGASLRSTARNIGIVVWIVLMILGFASLNLGLGKNFFTWLILVSIASFTMMVLGTITNRTTNTMFYLGTIALVVVTAFFLLELDVRLGLREKPAIFTVGVKELAIYERRGLSGIEFHAINDSATVKEYLVDRSDSFKPKNGERLVRVTWRNPKGMFAGDLSEYASEQAFYFGGGAKKKLTELRGSTGKSPANDQPPTRATITIPEPADIKSFKAYTVALKRGATVRTNVVPPAGSQVRFIQSSQDSCIAGMARAKPTKIVGSEELSFPTNYYNDPLEITSLSGDRTLEFHVF